MRVGKYPIYQNRGTFVVASMKLDDGFIMREYDQDARELLGSNLQLPFHELGFAEEHKQDIYAFLTSLSNEEDRLVSVIADRENRPRLMDIRGKRIENEETPYEISFFDISDMEADFEYFKDHMWKYRIMLGLSGLIFIDYSLDDDYVSVYRYIGRKSERIYYGTHEEFKCEILKYAEPDDKNVAITEKMLKQVESGENLVDCNVKNAILHRDHKQQNLHVRIRYYDMTGHRMMYGVIDNLSENDEDLPFYLTSAGLDSMTGLLNKRSLIEYTENILSNPATSLNRHYMILLDMDDFKRINDNYGHQAGDKAIILLARVITDVLGGHGIVGRYGGDEFYILTDGIEDEETLRSYLRLIRGNMESNAKKELGIDGVTLSMGVATFPDTGTNYSQLFELADKSLYIAKERGKNRYIIYRPLMHEDVGVGATRHGISSYDEQAKVMNQAVRSLFVDGKNAIEATFPQIIRAFDLDSIDIFYGPELKRLYSYGKYSSDLDCKVFLENKKYVEGFDVSGLYVVNNYHNFVKTNPEMFEYLGEKKCMSLIQLALPSLDKPEFFFSCNLLNHNHKWSDAEISNLSLYGTLLYELIKRDK